MWVPDSTSDFLMKFSLEGVLIACWSDWDKPSSVDVLWYHSIFRDVFFLATNFCATSWVTKSLMVFLSISIASAWTIKLWIASTSAHFSSLSFYLWLCPFLAWIFWKLSLFVFSMCWALSLLCSIAITIDLSE